MDADTSLIFGLFIVIIIFVIAPFSYYIYKGYKGGTQKILKSPNEQQEYKSEKSAKPTPSSRSSNINNANIIEIAERQKSLLRTLLIFLLCLILLETLSLFAAFSRDPSIQLLSSNQDLLRLVCFFIYFAIVYKIYKLAKALRLEKPWLSFVLSLIPLVNLFILISVNSEATKKLKACGIPVGLLGIRHKDLN
jgi:hypothetical protein